MRTLYIDLASHHGGLGCATADHIAAWEAVDGRLSEERLLPLIESMLKQAGWQYSDLDRVACMSGPGGFTSLRMAAACTNALAAELGIPAVGIHASDVYQARCESGDWLWLHATKKDLLFVRGFGKYVDSWPQPTLLAVAAAAQQLPTGADWAGELLPEQQDQLAPLELKPAPLRTLADALPAVLAAQQYSAELVLPWYGREG